MSAEAISSNNGAEFHARPVQTTERGTEVSPSQTGNRILDAANRIATFLDRFKAGRQEVRENVQDKAEQGRAFLRSAGEKAVDTAVKVGNVVSATALVGAEFAVGAAVLTGQAVEQRAQAVGAKASEITGYVTEGIAGGIDYAKQKGTEVKEAATTKYEAVRGFFQDRAETAKQNMQKLRRNWIAKYSRTRRGAIQTVEAGKAFAQETGENIKHNAKVIRNTGQLAMANYRTNAVPIMPKQ